MIKRVIITGGSQGIGLAAAQRFLQEGYEVVNLSRKTIPLGGVQQITADLQQLDWDRGCAAELQAVAESTDELVLIHNAACQLNDRVDELDAEQFHRVLQINLVAPQQLNRMLIPLMSPGSSVLYVGSTLAEKAVPGFASYVASKHGLIGLMRSTVQDLAGRGIHSACICPGFTDTSMLRSQLDQNPGLEEVFTAMVTMGRLVHPQEIADTLYFCARNPVLNGSVIHANLGQIER